MTFMAYFSVPATTNLTIVRREICASILEQTKQLARNMRFKLCAGIITSIKSLLHSKRFIARHRKGETDFTRQRKLPFHVLICVLADFIKGSYQGELDKFFQALRGAELPERYVSKAAFTKARAKVDYGAFVELGQCLVSAFQRTFIPVTWQGFRLLALDSSTIRLPRIQEIASHFGVWMPRQGKPCPMARASLLFDTLNKLCIGALVSPKGMNEREQARVLFELLMPHDLLLLDRGYPCFWLFKIILSKGAHFCARMPKNLLTVKALCACGSRDTIIDWPLPPTSAHQCAQRGIDAHALKLRVIRIDTTGGEPLFLATSLLDGARYPYELFVNLYRHRWPVEEDYKVIKCRLEMENFTGKTVLSIYQDFYAKIFFKNLVAVLSFPVNQALTNTGIKRKHPHQINFAHTLSLSKRLVVVLLQRSTKKVLKILQQFLQLLLKTTEPVRPGRRYPRNVRTQERRFFPAYKPIG
jgi:hypothetical protein